MSSALASALPAKGKSPEAFRTISEVSFELDVPQHVLRFWETRFSQVRPVKRAGGRRFYRPDDVALLKGIRSLLYSDGYTIKGVQKVLRDKGWRFVAEIGRTVSGAVPWHSLDEVGADETGVDEIGTDEAEEGTSELALADAPEMPSHPNPAMAALLRAHPAGEALQIAERSRIRLELLLAELLVMRDRLRKARPKHADSD